MELHDREKSEEAAEILRGIIQHNTPHHHQIWCGLTVFVRNQEGRVAAGLNGYTDWGWLFVKLLGVE